MINNDDKCIELCNKEKIETIQKALRNGTFKSDAVRITKNMLAIDSQLIKVQLIKATKHKSPEKV